MRRRLLGCVVLGVGFLLSGCPKQVPPPDTEVTDAGVAEPPKPDETTPVVEAPSGPGLVVTVEPADAELIIDGSSYGAVSALASGNGFLPLKPGIYQVALKKPGYTSWRAEVTVNESPEHLTVSLERQ